MNIYISNETNFNNNGLGFLTDTLSAVVHNELNGDYSLTLEYAVNGNLSEYLERENIIKCTVADGTKQLFRIVTVKKNFQKIQVYARHIFYDLLNNFLADTYPQNKNGQAFLEHILNNTNFATSFTAYSDIATLKSARYVRINPVQAIIGDIDNSMVNIFGGEIKRNNFTINFLSRIGEDNGVKLLIGKNITGIDISVDISEMATRVMPQGFDGLLLPELYVDSPYINNYPTPKIVKLEFEDVVYDPDNEDAYHTLNDAYAALRNKVYEQYEFGLDKPTINVNVNWVELSKTNEYRQYSNLETVRLGDTITAELLGLNYQTRVISTDYNVLLDRITNFQIGNMKPTIATQMNKIEKNVDSINPSTILKTAKDNATNLITTAMGGYIYKTQSELYIMDNPDPELAQKVWRWNINGLGYSSTGINGTYGIAMTMDGAIVADFITTGTLNTNVIQGYGSLTTQVRENTDAIGDRTGKTSTITQDIASIEAQISDIADVTTSASSDTAVIQSSELQNIADSYPIRIEIHPIIDNISYLYPNTGLYPSSTTYLKIRKIKFTNTSTSETFEYTLPIDLLYYDENNYDTFVADYETDLITITKKCKYNADGTVGLLTTPTVTTDTFTSSGIDFSLTEGNYMVTLPSYTNGFIFVRLMVLNAYTAQYATKVELNSAITQTVENINLSVNQRLSYYSTTSEMNAAINIKADEINSVVATKVGNEEIISRINQTSEAITIDASKVNIGGVITAINNNTTTTIDGSKITTGTITASQVSSDIITTTNFSAQNINANNITAGTINVARIPSLNANKITAGQLSGVSIKIGSYFKVSSTGIAEMTTSAGYLTMGTTSHPYVSALNVAKGAGGISFRSGTTQGDAGNQVAEIYLLDNNYLRINPGSRLYVDGHYGLTGQAGFIDSNGNRFYLAFWKGILVGASRSAFSTSTYPWLI